MNRIFLFLLATMFFSSQYSCTQVKQDNKVKSQTPYIPGIKKVFDLPDYLHEISGISFIDSVNLVAIQDEERYIYYYNITQQKVIGKEKFAGPGDYEDVMVAGNTTPFTGKNNLEGITYDAANNRLLIAPKNEGRNKKPNIIQLTYEN